jgi:5'-methylthioadenosine phosphorylase
MRVAIIGGTGMQQVSGFTLLQEIEPVAEITLFEGTLHGVPLVLLPRHAKGHRVPPHQIDHKQHVSVLQQLGVTHVFATAAVGSLHTDWDTGTLVILSDFLDFTREVHTLFNDEVRHTDFTHPFSLTMRKALQLSALEENIPIQSQGVYVCAPGPRYETPAEIRMYRMLGGDVIGMTVSPEAILCREAGIEYAAIAAVTNLGSGLSESPLGHGEVTEAMSFMQEKIALLFARAIEKLGRDS